MRFTDDYSTKIKKLRQALDDADAVLIGAGSGLSAAAGLVYSGPRFQQWFADFHEKYGIDDMYSGGFYPFETLEEYWAWWSRHIYCNRYEPGACEVYQNLLTLMQGRNYFVLTTNVDHQFQLAGFEKERLFYTQGDYGLWQCRVPCRRKTYDNEEAVRQMVSSQQNMRIPTSLIPYCPVCGRPMTMNLRIDSRFVEDEGWKAAYSRYENFLKENREKRILFLELGVGKNTPAIIKYPFWHMTQDNPQATYACLNQFEAICPSYIENQSICIGEDIAVILEDLNSM